MENIREKTYTYIDAKGKQKQIHRKWSLSADKINRNNIIDKYFADNADRIKEMKKIKNVYDDFVGTHDLNVTYGMIYQKYIKLYSKKKDRKQQSNTSSEEADEYSNNDE